VDVGTEAVEDLEARAREQTSVFVAALNPRTDAAERGRIDLFVDTKRLHFFDMETGMGIYGDGGRSPSG
jgi:hypothetical protein